LKISIKTQFYGFIFELLISFLLFVLFVKDNVYLAFAFFFLAIILAAFFTIIWLQLLIYFKVPNKYELNNNNDDWPKSPASDGGNK